MTDLQDYLDGLKTRDHTDCWYVVKQTNDFDDAVDSIDVLLEFQKAYRAADEDSKPQSQKYFEDNSQRLTGQAHNYRIISSTYNLGLLTNDTKKYKDAKITNVFKLIQAYKDLENKMPFYSKFHINMLKNMQLEKMFIPNGNEQHSDSKLFPAPIIYKVMLELLDKYGITQITRGQFSALIATIRHYDEIDTIIPYLKETSDDKTILQEKAGVVVIKGKEEDRSFNNYFDNRVWNVITQLSAIVPVGKGKNINAIKLSEDNTSVLREKVKAFWDHLDIYANITDDEYADLLTNNIELWDWYKAKEAPELRIDESTRNKGGQNVIYYGAPGTGKSHEVDKIVKEKYQDENDREEYVFRVTLHPDYEYTDFVGQILPYRLPGNGITYKFVPNIFTLALEKAYENPDKDVYLILEEMSRANVAAVFGDLFQLLDRKEDGSSEYSINNKDIADIVYGDPRHKVTIPSNMTIYGTVNTSDQNVFTMDTAFKRRFEWKYVSTTYGKDNVIVDSKIEIEKGIEVKWTDFYQALNKFIVSDLGLNEDKQIGPFFIKFEKEDSKDVQDGTKTKAHKLVQNKLLQYLWEDVNAAAYDSSKSLFLDKKEIPSFSKLYERFGNGEPIFSKAFKEKLGIKDVEN